MRKKSDYMILSLLGASGLFAILSVCAVVAGCGNAAAVSIQDTESGTYTQEPDTSRDALEEVVESPPSLEVIYVTESDAAISSEDSENIIPSESGGDGDRIILSFGNGSWEVREDGDMGAAAVYCGAHPLDMNYESATIQLDPEQELHVLELNFGVKPDSWEVVSVWNAEDVGDSDAYEKKMKYDSTVDFKDDNYMAAWEGNYIYEIRAVWDREGYGGEAYYCFSTACGQAE